MKLILSHTSSSFSLAVAPLHGISKNNLSISLQIGHLYILDLADLWIYTLQVIWDGVLEWQGVSYLTFQATSQWVTHNPYHGYAMREVSVNSTSLCETN